MAVDDVDVIHGAATAVADVLDPPARVRAGAPSVLVIFMPFIFVLFDAQAGNDSPVNTCC